LSQGKLQKQFATQCIQGGRISILKRGIMVEHGGIMRSSRGLESSQQLFSRVCVCVLFVSRFCCLASKASTLILGTPKDCNSPFSLQGRSQKGWV